MTPDIDQTIAQILVDKFHLDAALIRPDAALEDLGLDSLTLMEFVFAIEDAFNLRIPEERLDPRQGGITLSHLAEVIREHLASQATQP
ncbi:phosphopantetheine-binding protein [Curvibacter sp. RS43]|uniref:Phosphopantetheine-binding protein n=1 Tax=Curvibacter microcysteis TaxID=3026419 RepID=A0ABT5MBK8_9BURK|nr:MULTISPECIES: phosphopantetheine-binding protein [unclassified Curvibacter]MDD0811081.1 phosphopantetheine-binding protein [Curvibacter sp. RS43]MDD0813948.1 phosphopantetheine-binding protein [Curvibacter sp. HBC28]